MPKFSTFLKLTLPELSEFTNSWNEPLNQNFESLDDWTKELHASLVGGGSTGSVWAGLKGSVATLQVRLDKSLLPDGTIDVSTSPGILDMATSSYRTDPAAPFSDPRARLNDGDRELYEAGQPFPEGRFAPILPAGPSAGFPHAEADAGIALRSADFGANSLEPISSPQVPWAPGFVTGGSSPFITGGAVGQVQLNAATIPAVFNIDGYVFRLREDILFDYSTLAGLLDLDYVWIYVERKEANYNTAAFKYSEPGGVPAAKDLRKLKVPTSSDGATSGSTFTSASGTWDTLPFKVKEGDVLRILSGTAAGDYVIDALDATTPDTKLTIKGVFNTDVGGLNYEIRDDFMPNIGAALATSVPGDPSSRPPFVEGRTYIGRVKHLAGGSPSPRVTFARGGVFDSGWLPSGQAFPLDISHNLGAIPSSVEIWVRANSTLPAYKPLVKRTVVTNFDTANATVEPADVSTAVLLFPSLLFHSTDILVRLVLFNASTLPLAANAIFTDEAGIDHDAAGAEIRVIARR